MISRLRGTVLERTSSKLVVDVQGVGYELTVSPQCVFRAGSSVDLQVRTHLRDDAILLFGFSSALEREVFDLLVTVPNIGPSKAMGILASPPGDVIALVRKKEPARLAKLPGVGKKTAERMIVDLCDKFASLAQAGGEMGLPLEALDSGQGAHADDLTSALVNLGFRASVAEEAARQTVDRLGPEVELPALLRHALSHASARASK